MAETSSAPPLTYTARSRRPRHLHEDSHGLITRFHADTKAAPAPAPANPPRPQGELGTASVGEIVAATRRVWPNATRTVMFSRLRGVRAVLEHLAGFAGESWQQRWTAAGLGERHISLGDVLFPEGGRVQKDAVTGVRILFCLRVITPSVPSFRSYRFSNYPDTFRMIAADPGLDRLFDAVLAYTDAAHVDRVHAMFDVCAALTTQGIALADLTPSALLHYTYECRRHGVTIGATGDTRKFGGVLAWHVLREMGHFPASTPPSPRASAYRGRRSVTEMVDHHGVPGAAVRQVFIDYLSRRSAELDYATLENLARHLVGYFWNRITEINPAQTDFVLAEPVYAQWRESINWREPKNGEAPERRLHPENIVVSVRGFYADLHSWAVEDPGRWGPWVAPCPVRYGELRGAGKRRRRVKERIDDRIRVRQPLLPALVEYVETRYEHARDLLAAAEAAAAAGVTRFRFGQADYERVVSVRARVRAGQPVVRLRMVASGEVVNQTQAEDYCFWRWAVVEVLRASGIRIEELCELTHLSIRQYRRPNGEVIALLVIAPSKNDRERVIPMSAELFHVIARIIARHTAGGQTIAVIPRYDTQDKIWSAPLPHLFQRQVGMARTVIAAGTIVFWLRDTCAALAETNPAFAQMHFTPHDFRRLFATELANSGLPVHIGAALLGHLDLDTFRGYVTVFDEDVVRHYQSHLAARRRLRPADEYAAVTEAEWSEFEEHFDQRKVELGGCARPYGSPCQHEHACIRCPMLTINPKMIGRLDDIEADLLERRARAEREAWVGEIEGLDLTLTYLRQKREQTQRLSRLSAVGAGPTMLTLDRRIPESR
ncbi:site-specific integrase [Nocardia thailandica]|uniref:site-specific integrase n=1 Tax=Nocardia thailandica TaxID=257275 RepID=UPI0002D30810|nr:site-specific integrase [Nocardia thailandica]